MQYIAAYQSPLGDILLAADEMILTGLWFEGENFYALSLGPEHAEREIPFFARLRQWLAICLSGREPHFMPPVHLIGSDFRLCVGHILRQIPYGKTITCGPAAKQVVRGRGLKRISALAVGGAVGHNEISIIVPCHRAVEQTEVLRGTRAAETKNADGRSLKVSPRENSWLPSRERRYTTGRRVLPEDLI